MWSGQTRALRRFLYLVFFQSRDFSRFVLKRHVSSIIVVLFFSWITVSDLNRYLSASGSCCLLLLNNRLGQSYPSISAYYLKSSEATVTKLFIRAFKTVMPPFNICLKLICRDGKKMDLSFIMVTQKAVPVFFQFSSLKVGCVEGLQIMYRPAKL